MKELLANKHRKAQGKFLVEGPKMAAEALASGYLVLSAVYTTDFAAKNTALLAQLAKVGAQLNEADEQVLLSLCDTKTPQGVICALAMRTQTAPNGYAGNWIALEDVQDPGNVGSIIRTADAMGFSGVLLSDACADAFSPKVLRASMGSVFHIPIIQSEIAQQIKIFRQSGFLIIASHLEGDPATPSNTNMLLLIGNESKGLSTELTMQADCLWKIPMKGKAESLGAAAAAAIMLYELAK